MKIESKVCCEDVSAGKIKEDKVEKKETQRGNLDREEKILKSLALWVKTGCKNIAPCLQSFSLPSQLPGSGSALNRLSSIYTFYLVIRECSY